MTLPVFAEVIAVKYVVFSEAHGFVSLRGREEDVNEG